MSSPPSPSSRSPQATSESFSPPSAFLAQFFGTGLTPPPSPPRVPLRHPHPLALALQVKGPGSPSSPLSSRPHRKPLPLLPLGELPSPEADLSNSHLWSIVERLKDANKAYSAQQNTVGELEEQALDGPARMEQQKVEPNEDVLPKDGMKREDEEVEGVKEEVNAVKEEPLLVVSRGCKRALEDVTSPEELHSSQRLPQAEIETGHESGDQESRPRRNRKRRKCEREIPYFLRSRKPPSSSKRSHRTRYWLRP